MYKIALHLEAQLSIFMKREGKLLNQECPMIRDLALSIHKRVHDSMELVALTRSIAEDHVGQEVITLEATQEVEISTRL